MAEIRLTRDSHDDGWWEMAVRQAAPRLCGYVRGYVGYREDSRVPVRRTEIPTGDVSVIISFGLNIHVLDPGDPDQIPRLEAGDPFATIAHDCGFSDQAHLNRDLRRITGSTPSEWAAGHGMLYSAVPAT